MFSLATIDEKIYVRDRTTDEPLTGLPMGFHQAESVAEYRALVGNGPVIRPADEKDDAASSIYPSIGKASTIGPEDPLPGGTVEIYSGTIPGVTEAQGWIFSLGCQWGFTKQSAWLEDLLPERNSSMTRIGIHPY